MKLPKIIEDEVSLEELNPSIYNRKHGPDWLALHLTQVMHNWRIVELPTSCGDDFRWIEFGVDISGNLFGFDWGCMTHDCPIETIWKREE